MRPKGPPAPDQGSASTLEPPSDDILKPALRLLSHRLRTVAELRSRLLEKGFPTQEVRHCLQWLEERDLLDDETFAQAHSRDRLRFSPRSPFLLKRELTKKGVRASLAVEVIERVFEEEGVGPVDLAVQAATGWVKRQSPRTRAALLAKRFSPEREKVRRRLYGFLARRGFKGDEARRGMEAGEEEARELEE